MRFRLGGFEIALILSAACSQLFAGGIAILPLAIITALYLAKGKADESKLILMALFAIFIPQPSFLLYFVILFPVGYVLTHFFGSELTFLERLLVSFPLTLLFFIPIQLLSYLNFPISTGLMLFVVSIAPLSFLYFNHKRVATEIKHLAKLRLKIDSDLLAALIILIFTILVWSPLLTEAAIPRTAGAGYYAYVAVFEERINNFHSVPLWDHYQNLGFAIFTFDSLVYFYTVGYVDMLNPLLNLTGDFNCLFFLSMFLLGLSIYALSKRVGFATYPSVLPALFFLSNPYLSRLGIFTGYSKTFFAFAWAPLIIILFMIAAKNAKYFLLAALLAVTMFMSHQHVIIQAGALAFLYYLLTNLSGKKLIPNSDLKYLLPAAALFVGVLSFYIVPALAYMKGHTLLGEYPYYTLKNFLLQFLRESKGIDSNAGIGLTACAFAGIAGYYSKKRERALALLFASLLILTALYYLPGVSQYYNKTIDIEKLELVWLLVFSISVPGIFAITKDKKLRGAIFFILLIVVGYYAAETQAKNKEWVSEQFQNGQIMTAEMDFLKTLPPARFLTYGVFSPVIDQIIPLFTGKPAVGNANRMAQQTNIYFYKVHSIMTESVPEGATLEYVLNVLRQSWAGYIVLNACTPSGFEVFNIFKESTVPAIYFDQQCMLILNPNPGAFAEKVALSKVSLTEKELYDTPGAYKVADFRYRQPGDSFDYQIKFPADVSLVPEPVELQFSRPSPEEIHIYGDFKKGDWVLVKEEEFPRWRAYTGGKELRVEMSNLGLMLIQAETGNEITLLHKPAPFEVLLAAISTILLLSVFLALRGKE
ncbi:MAG: 6-pyruvoyl-tetrahydropterin synthase-related protein [archaeon]